MYVEVLRLHVIYKRRASKKKHSITSFADKMSLQNSRYRYAIVPIVDGC